MKKIIFLSLALGLFTVACKSDKKTQLSETLTEKSTKEDQKKAAPDVQKLTHKVDAENSKLSWKGYKPTGSHHGVISLKEGGIHYDGTKIKSGYFIFDMTSIICLDLPAEDPYNQKLVKHLNSPDFFDTENHQTAKFSITEMSSKEGQTSLSGDLTIKGITKSISFPVNLTESENGLQLVANAFQIDRTEYDIQYKSKKFFDNLKDKFINDEFEVSFDVSLK